MSATANLAGSLGVTVADAVIAFQKASVFNTLIKMVPAQPGTLTARIPVYAALASSNVEQTEGDATLRTLTSAAIDCTGARNTVATSVTDSVLLGSGDNVYGNVGGILGNTLAAQFDNEVAALYAGVSNTVGTAGASMALSFIFDAVEYLRTNNAPGEYFAVLHPKQIWGAKGLSAVVDSTDGTIVEDIVRTGYFQTIGGVHIFYSPEIEIDGDDDAQGLVFASEAFGAGYKDFGGGTFIDIEEGRDAVGNATNLVANGYWKAAELVDTWATVLTSDVS